MKNILTLVALIVAATVLNGCTGGNKGKGAGQYCTYIVGVDCPCQGIASTDVICVACDSSQTDCPATVRFNIICPQNRDTCHMVSQRQSSTCTTCPRGSKKFKVVDGYAQLVD